MDVNLVTPHAVYNYGALLQAYGLRECLTGMGYDVSVYDFPLRKESRPHGLHEWMHVVLSKCCRALHRKSLRAGDRAFDRFIEQFPLNREANSPLYLVGSDQVWNPYNIDSVFSLEFTAPESRRASYAASMGISRIPEEFHSRFSSFLAGIESLSVREPEAAKAIRELTGRDCGVHIDPSFLLSAEQWRSVEEPLPIEEPYILVYALHMPKHLNQVVKECKKKYGCKVVLIDRRGYLNHLIACDIAVRNAGPREFLWLIDHARCVVTTSFHGTAFSTIFHKEFFSLVNPAAPSRINNLLNILQLSQRGLGGAEVPDLPEISYQTVDERIRREVDKSKQYLRNVAGEVMTQ